MYKQTEDLKWSVSELILVELFFQSQETERYRSTSFGSTEYWLDWRVRVAGIQSDTSIPSTCKNLVSPIFLETFNENFFYVLEPDITHRKSRIFAKFLCLSFFLGLPVQTASVGSVLSWLSVFVVKLAKRHRPRGLHPSSSPSPDTSSNQVRTNLSSNGRLNH